VVAGDAQQEHDTVDRSPIVLVGLVVGEWRDASLIKYQISVNAWRMLMMLAVVVVLLVVNAEYLQDLILKAVALVVLSKVCVVSQID
jgi:hypothetical protein